MVCLAKKVLVKSTRSAIALLFASAQKLVNSKLLLVFLLLRRVLPLCSLTWALRVVAQGVKAVQDGDDAGLFGERGDGNHYFFQLCNGKTRLCSSCFILIQIH